MDKVAAALYTDLKELEQSTGRGFFLLLSFQSQGQYSYLGYYIAQRHTVEKRSIRGEGVICRSSLSSDKLITIPSYNSLVLNNER